MAMGDGLSEGWRERSGSQDDRNAANSSKDQFPEGSKARWEFVKGSNRTRLQRIITNPDGKEVVGNTLRGVPVDEDDNVIMTDGTVKPLIWPEDIPDIEQ